MPVDDLSPQLAVHFGGLRLRPAAVQRERQEAGARAAGRKTGAGSGADLLDLRRWEIAPAEALEPHAVVAAAADALGDRHPHSGDASVRVLAHGGPSEVRPRQLELTGVRAAWTRRLGERAAAGGIDKRDRPRGRTVVLLRHSHSRWVVRPAADDEAETQRQCVYPDHPRTSDGHVEL